MIIRLPTSSYSDATVVRKPGEITLNKPTHINHSGPAHMVAIGAKDGTLRVARAAGRISMLPATLKQIAAGSAKKGDVLGTARIAAIQAAKRTAGLIPLCHPLALTRVDVAYTLNRKA